jgi:hypothetical protein
MKTTFIYTVYIVIIIILATINPLFRTEEINKKEIRQLENETTCDCGGPYQFSCSSQTIQLDGSGSLNAASFSWSISCYAGELLVGELSASVQSPSFTFGVDFSFTLCNINCDISLTVTDSAGSPKPCNSTMTVSDDATTSSGNETMSCSAGGPYEFSCSESLQLDGSASQADSYSWNIQCYNGDQLAGEITSDIASPLLSSSDFNFTLCNIDCDVSLTTTYSSGASETCNTTLSVKEDNSNTTGNETNTCGAGGDEFPCSFESLQLSGASTLNVASYSWNIVCYDGDQLAGELTSDEESPILYSSDFNFTVCDVECDVSLTVSRTDGSNQTCNSSFSVRSDSNTTTNNTNGDLSISVELLRPTASCDGEKGSVKVSFTGGNGPWKVTFSDGQEFNIDSEAPEDHFVTADFDVGSYQVTLSTPEASVNASFDIKGEDCESPVRMEWVGKSCQIKIWQPTSDGEEGDRFLKIKFMNIEERDSKDKVLNKINFPSSKLEMTGPKDDMKFDAKATYMNLHGDLKLKGGSSCPIDINVWFFKSEVTISTPDGSNHTYPGGALKFDVDISKYPFTGESHLVLQIDLLTPGNKIAPSTSNNSEVLTVPLADDDGQVFIPLVVDIDGELVDMDFDYKPHGSHIELYFSFPKHLESMHYDPILYLPEGPTDGSESMVKLLSGIIILLFLAL